MAYAIFLVAAVSPYVVLAWAWQRLPRVAKRITAAFQRLSAIDRRPWEFGIVLGTGLLLFGLGIWETTSPP